MMDERQALPPPTDLKAQVEQAMAELLRRRLDGFDWEALSRLALVPFWTRQLAETCIPSLDEFLRSAQAAGLAEPVGQRPDVRQSEAASPLEAFVMPAEVREQVLRALRDRRSSEALREAVATIGRELSAAPNFGDASMITNWWAQLAVRTDSGVGEAANWLESMIDGLIADNATGQALALVRAGESLAAALGGELPAAVRLGSGRLARAYRSVPDLHFLRHFLERPEQLNAFKELLKEENEHWALHYLGVGGVGKTMLLRHISANLSERLKLAVGRIDFDHISPEYPARRPAQLLVELADQLRPYFSTSREEAVAFDMVSEGDYLEELALSGQVTFTDLFREAEWTPDDSIEQEVPPDLLMSSPLGKVLRVFTDLLKLLERQGRRTVLILDTCEELAKIREDGKTPASVAATFSMLRAVHREVPSVRVVFAGRRLLARSGFGWEAEETDETAALADRSYLRLHVLRGFDRREATRYLKGRYRREKLDVTLSGEMREALLARCREASVPPSVRWSDGHAPDESQRYNPFDLDLYADLLIEEARLPEKERTLTPEVIALGKSDPYVEARIIRRIERDDVRRLLPAVVLLRRFDEEMFRPAMAQAGPSPQNAFLELSRQEWIHSSRDATLNTRFLEVDRNLLPRLERYFDQEAERPAVERAADLLAPHLGKLVDELSLQRLSVSHIEAALRLSPPEEAARLWEGLAARLTAEANWNWAQQVAGRLLGEGGVASAPETGGEVSESERARLSAHLASASALRASVLAVHTAARLHMADGVDLTPAWLEVAAHAVGHPDPGSRAWLELRACTGEIAATLRSKGAPRAACIGQFRELLKAAVSADGPPVRGWDDAVRREQETASLAAAVEAWLEFAEPTGIGESFPMPELVAHWADAAVERGVSAELAGFVLTLAARAQALNHKPEEGAERLWRAFMLFGTGPAVSRQRWLDWRAPASVVNRGRLETLLRLSRPLPSEVEAALPEYLNEARKNLDQIDAERLASLLTRRIICELPPDRALLSRLESEEIYRPDRQPECYAHGAVPTLRVTLALGRLALGEPEAAISQLDQRIQEARRNQRDVTTPREAELAKLSIIRRMRLPSRGQALVERSVHMEPQEQAAAWAVRALRGHYVEKSVYRDAVSFPALMVHAWLSTEEALTSSGAADILGILEFLVGKAQPADDFEQLTLMLDMREAMMVAERFNFSVPEDNLPFRPPDELPTDFAEQRLREQPMRAEDALRLKLRFWALYDIDDGSAHQWRVRVGMRRVAELMLEEGELLALRLPERAGKLLAAARAWFQRADDPVGVFIANLRFVIAEVHAGRVEQARQVLDDTVSHDYGVLRAAVGEGEGGIPAWEELSAWSERPDEAPLERLEHRDWAGWLHRLFCCLIWKNGREGELPQQLLNVLAESYGTLLPAELDLNRARGQETGAHAAPRRDDTLRLVIASTQNLPPNQLADPSALLPVSMSLEEGEDTYVVQGVAPGLRSPQEAVRDLPPDLTTALVRLSQSGRQSVSLYVAAEVASAPWEAVLQLALPEGEPLRWYRSGPTVARRAEASASEWRGVEVFCNPAWRRMAENGWQPLGAEVTLSVNLYEYLARLRANATSQSEQTPPRLLHLVGRPVRTSRGLSLKVEAGLSGSGSAQVRSEAPSRGENLISPDDVPPQQGSVVVLQGEPAHTLGGLASEREQTADLRSLAGEFFKAGAGAVVMLPTLPVELAESVLSALASGLADAPSPGLPQLLDAVAAARRVIGEFIESPEEDSRELLFELAFGVTLFARPTPAG